MMLNLEDFSSCNANGKRRFRNFFGYFLPDSALGKTYRKKECYVRFASEHPEMAKSLCGKTMAARDAKWSISKELNRELYEAYKIMSGYGISDKDIFL